MKKQDLKSGMLLRISAGTGTYTDKKYAAIIRVISVTTHKDEVRGFQFQFIAERGANHDPDFLLYKKNIQIHTIGKETDDWFETFKPKLLV